MDRVKEGKGAGGEQEGREARAGVGGEPEDSEVHGQGQAGDDGAEVGELHGR